MLIDRDSFASRERLFHSFAPLYLGTDRLLHLRVGQWFFKKISQLNVHPPQIFLITPPPLYNR